MTECGEPPKDGNARTLIVAVLLVGVVLVVAAGVLCLAGVFLREVFKTRTMAERMSEQGKVHAIGLAFHNFASYHGGTSFPCGVAYRSPDGKPLLSWRVALLPYLGEDDLFDRFKLNESWDGPNNIRLLSQIPSVYLRPNQQPGPYGLTHYLAVAGRGTVFDERYPGCQTVPGSTLRLGTSIVGITGGPSNTLLIVTATEGVPWTKPEDFDVDDGPISPRLDRRFGEGTNVCSANARGEFAGPYGERQWRTRMSATGRPDAGPD